MVRAPVGFGPAGGQDIGPVTMPAPMPAPMPGPSAADVVDVTAVTEQLGRAPRGLLAVAHRCPCGLPDVVETAPRLPDGTPFPTLYYLTCPRAVAAVSRLEAGGAMRGMTQRLGAPPKLQQAHPPAPPHHPLPRAHAA